VSDFPSLQSSGIQWRYTRPNARRWGRTLPNTNFVLGGQNPMIINDLPLISISCPTTTVRQHRNYTTFCFDTQCSYQDRALCPCHWQPPLVYPSLDRQSANQLIRLPMFILEKCHSHGINISITLADSQCKFSYTVTVSMILILVYLYHVKGNTG